MKVLIATEFDPDLVLDVESKESPLCAQLFLARRDNSPSQVFIYNAKEPSIKNEKSGLAVDIRGGEVKGAGIILYNQNKRPNQQFRLHKDGTIRSKNGLCLEIKGDVIEPGTRIRSWSHNGTEAQRWKMIPV